MSLRHWHPSPRAKGLLIALVVAVVAIELVVVVRMTGREEAVDDGAAVDTTARVRAPQGLEAGGSVVRGTVQDDGTIGVTQWVRTGPDVDQITLTAADDVVAADLDVVAADGRVVAADREVVGDEVEVVVLPASTRLLRLTFDLSGATERTGSTAGRALADVTALDVDYGAQGAATVTVAGPQVLNLACEPSDGLAAEARSCGEPGGSGTWTVRLAGDEQGDRVVAQVDLR